MFQSKGNTGKTSKKHSEDDKNLDAECDEDWGRISHMHKRYFEDLVDVLLFSNAKLTFYSRAVVLSFLFCLMQRSRIGKTFYVVAPCLFCALPSVLYHFFVFFFFLRDIISLFDSVVFSTAFSLCYTPFCIYCHILKKQYKILACFKMESQPY